MTPTLRSRTIWAALVLALVWILALGLDSIEGVEIPAQVYALLGVAQSGIMWALRKVTKTPLGNSKPEAPYPSPEAEGPTVGSGSPAPVALDPDDAAKALLIGETVAALVAAAPDVVRTPTEPTKP